METQRIGAWTRAARVQGMFYLVTGAWPLLHMRSFLAVTGPKRELWLVRSVGASLAAVGAGLLDAGTGGGGGVRRSHALTGAAVAAGLAAVDLSPDGPRRISRVYLADAVLQIALVAAWAAGAVRRGARRR